MLELSVNYVRMGEFAKLWALLDTWARTSPAAPLVTLFFTRFKEDSLSPFSNTPGFPILISPWSWLRYIASLPASRSPTCSLSQLLWLTNFIKLWDDLSLCQFHRQCALHSQQITENLWKCVKRIWVHRPRYILNTYSINPPAPRPVGKIHQHHNQKYKCEVQSKHEGKYDPS